MGVQGGREDEGKKIVSENLRKAQPNAQLHLPVRLIALEMQTVLPTKAVERSRPFWESTSGIGVLHKTWATQNTGVWRVWRKKKNRTLLLRMQHQCLWVENFLQINMKCGLLWIRNVEKVRSLQTYTITNCDLNSKSPKINMKNWIRTKGGISATK